MIAVATILIVADFSPAGRKIGNNKTKSTLLPQAKTDIEIATAYVLSDRAKP
jgi:hypothetical protein